MTTTLLVGVVAAAVAALALLGGPRLRLLAPGGPPGVHRRGRAPVGPRGAGATEPGAVVVRVLAVAGCLGLGWAVLGGALGLAAGAGAGVAAWLALARLEAPGVKRRRAAQAARFPLLLDLLAGIVEAGAPLRLAVAQVAAVVGSPYAEPLEAVVAACRLGSTDAEAWRALAGDPLWGEVARELARSVESGTAAARILRTQAEAARRARAASLLTKARAVGVKSSLPLMACFLPAFLLVGVVPIIGGLIGSYLH